MVVTSVNIPAMEMPSDEERREPVDTGPRERGSFIVDKGKG